jgi:hypothetical protein
MVFVGQSTLEAELADKKALVEWNMRRVAIRNERFDAPGEMVVDEPQRVRYITLLATPLPPQTRCTAVIDVLLRSTCKNPTSAC